MCLLWFASRPSRSYSLLPGCQSLSIKSKRDRTKRAFFALTNQNNRHRCLKNCANEQKHRKQALLLLSRAIKNLKNLKLGKQYFWQRKQRKIMGLVSIENLWTYRKRKAHSTTSTLQKRTTCFRRQITEIKGLVVNKPPRSSQLVHIVKCQSLSKVTNQKKF